MNIRIKYFSDKLERLRYVDGKSDWIDLRAAGDVELKAGEFKLIPLGIAMELPRGYEAHIVPRSSTFKNFGIIQTITWAWWTRATAGIMTSGFSRPTRSGTRRSG